MVLSLWIVQIYRSDCSASGNRINCKRYTAPITKHGPNSRCWISQNKMNSVEEFWLQTHIHHTIHPQQLVQVVTATLDTPLADHQWQPWNRFLLRFFTLPRGFYFGSCLSAPLSSMVCCFSVFWLCSPVLCCHYFPYLSHFGSACFVHVTVSLLLSQQ